MDTAKDSTNPIYGILFISVIVFASLYFANLSWVKELHISALLIGVMIGAILSPVFARSKKDLQPGVNFCAKKMLRFGIVLYGFNVTLLEMAKIGMPGFIAALVVVVVIFGLGTYLGMKLFGLDRDVAMLVSGGSAICGAAAVLALESSIKSEPYKGIIAVGTVIVFGLLAMFLYPLAYALFLHNYLDSTQMGLYIGATLHEVANVVGAGGAISPEVASIAVTTKMIRVILLVPLLLLIPYLLTHNHQRGRKRALHIPWFAFMFLAMVVLNSYIHPLFDGILGVQMVDLSVQNIQFICSLSLLFAMSALGVQIDMKKFLSSGGKAFSLALLLFVILVIGGFFLVRFLV